MTIKTHKITKITQNNKKPLNTHYNYNRVVKTHQNHRKPLKNTKKHEEISKPSHKTEKTANNQYLKTTTNPPKVQGPLRALTGPQDTSRARAGPLRFLTLFICVLMFFCAFMHFDGFSAVWHCR